MAVRNLLAGSLALSIASLASANDLFFQRFGNDQSDNFGADVAAAGDVNADGYDDVIIGVGDYHAPHMPAIVMSGRNGQVLLQLPAMAGFGVQVAGVGDMNKDGHDDVALGGGGDVVVYSGQTGGVLYAFGGGPNTAGFGMSIDGAGDINNDSFPDIIIGAPLTNAGTGHVIIFSGKDGFPLLDWYGPNTNSGFGLAVSRAGDLNHDGYDDVLVGCPYREFFGTPSPVVYAYSGKDASLLDRVTGPTASEFGTKVQGGRDLNGDGTTDFIVGAPYHDNYRGAAYVYSGSNFALLFTVEGAHEGDIFATSVDVSGDINGDGKGDFLVGSPYERGGFIFSYRGSLRIYSGANGSLIKMIGGHDANNVFFGASAASAGDVNQDGRFDIVVGDPGYSNDGSGSAHVFSGMNYNPSFQNYGVGLAGKNGVPILTLDKDPILCGDALLHVGNSLGSTTAGVLFLGFSQASIATPWGSDILVGMPWTVIGLTVPANGFYTPLEIVCDSALAGVTAYMQVLELDHYAANDISFSRGLEMTIGLDTNLN